MYEAPNNRQQTEKIDYPKATRLLYYAIAHVVNYVDTAYFYHAAVFGQPGKSEPFLGEALSGGWRKKVHLATKMPLLLLRHREQMDTFLKEQLGKSEIVTTSGGQIMPYKQNPIHLLCF